MLAPHLVVGRARVAERDFGLVSAWFHRDGNHGLGAFGGLGHPGVFDNARPLELEEAPVVGPSPAFMLHGETKEAINRRIQNDAIRSESWSAGALRVDPDVEDFRADAGDSK